MSQCQWSRQRRLRQRFRSIHRRLVSRGEWAGRRWERYVHPVSASCSRRARSLYCRRGRPGFGSGERYHRSQICQERRQCAGLDFSQRMMDKGRERYEKERDQFPGTIEYGFIDLMDVKGMMACMQKRKDSLGEADDQ